MVWRYHYGKRKKKCKNGIKYDMVRVYSKMETHVDGEKQKSVFQKEKPYALAKIRIKEQVCRYLEIRQTCFFMQKKIEM